MSETKSNKFALYVSIGKIAAMLAQFAMPMFLTRFLSKADYGTYAQFYLVLGYLGSIFCFGLQSNPYYFYPGSSEEKKKKIIWNTFICIIFLGTIGALLLLIPPIRDFFINNEILATYIYIVIATIIFTVPTYIVDLLSVVRKDKKLAVIYHPLSTILKIIFVITFALFFNSIQGILSSILLLSIVLFIFVVIYVLKKYPIRSVRDCFSFSLLKQQLRYSIPFGVAVILSSTCHQIDKLVCVNYLTPENYAIYSIAFFGIPGIMIIYDSLCQVNVMNMASVYKEGDIASVSSLYKRFVVQTLSFSLPLICVVCLFSPQIIDFLFSEKYMQSVPFFRLYVLTFILGMIGSGTILRAVGKTRLSMRAFAYSSVVCIPMTFLLISKFGIWGAISSAMINVMLPKIIQVAFECRLLGLPISQYFPVKEIGKLFGVSVVLLIPLLLLNYFFSLNLIVCIVLSLLYVLVVYWFEIKENIFLVDRQKIIGMTDKYKQYLKKGTD